MDICKAWLLKISHARTSYSAQTSMPNAYPAYFPRERENDPLLTNDEILLPQVISNLEENLRSVVFVPQTRSDIITNWPE